MPRQRCSLLFLSFLLVLAVPCFAQSPCPTQVIRGGNSGLPAPVMSPDLICLVPQVYGPGGLVGASNGGPAR